MTEVNVGDVIYRAYYFGDEVILDESKVIAICSGESGLDEIDNTYKIERSEDKSIHDVKSIRVKNDWSTSRMKALIKLFDKHMNVLQKVLAKMENIDNDR